MITEDVPSTTSFSVNQAGTNIAIASAYMTYDGHVQQGGAYIFTNYQYMNYLPMIIKGSE